MIANSWCVAAIERLISLATSQHFRASAVNAVYSVAEYFAQPAAMLIAAPFLVHKLGLQQYGIWMLVSAILGSVGILSAGFGDATVKYVSAYRGRNDAAGIERTIRATLTINACLGILFALFVWMLAPLSVDRVFKVESGFHLATIQAIRVAAIILVVRSVESVLVGTLRAFERYGPPVTLNVFLRSVVIVSAVVLAAFGKGVVSIMVATLLWSVLVVVLLAIAARRVVGTLNLLPTAAQEHLGEVFSFGCYSWLQSLAGVVFSYADRLLVAAMLGTAPVAIYVLCVQATQPIHGLSAAAFNFVFPHISSRHEAGEIHGPRRVFRFALATSAALSCLMALPLILFGKQLLTLWMGASFAEQAHVVLALLAVAYGLLALNIVPHYALLAFGRVRMISALNGAAGLCLIGFMVVLVPQLGMKGAALARIVYSLLLAVPYFVASRRTIRARAQLASLQFS
jgi:O-antigen/teichoic acid export membrane protein